jgi:glycosyltransferase involved in cell wall biosynthesis
MPPPPSRDEDVARYGGASPELAWDSPRAAAGRSGIAAYSAEILPLLGARKHEVDVFVDRAPAKGEAGVFNAHDYVWKRRRNLYDVTVFQLGNATCHDYMWAYLFRFPGMVVLHDAQLHQARALSLTKAQWRKDDYLEEFRANHPTAPPGVAYLVLTRMMGGTLYQMWPHIRLVVESARLTVVHNARVRDALAAAYPAATFDSIEMGVADPMCSVQGAGAGRVPGAPTCTVTAFGGVTPEKRLGPIIRAMAKARRRRPELRLVIVGAPSADYDVMEEAARAGIADRVHVTGYVDDRDVPQFLADADICACLRWPTNRETSASWLRCLAAGKPTLITELSHLIDVPAINPQTWGPRSATTKDPVAVSIDMLDEEASIQTALERLAADADLRGRLGRAARAWWEAHHTLDMMADHYERVLARAATLPPPRVSLPRHLTDDGTATAHALADTMGVTPAILDLFD